MIKKLIEVQKNLKVNKNQFNKFGNYSYRSCEDIIEAVKPLLNEVGLLLNIKDELVLIGERYYIKATATITDGENEMSSSAYAREPLNKKGMDESQITGASSSYARKYALNGLLAIDDMKDGDATNTHEKETKLSEKQVNRLFAIGKTKGVDAVNIKKVILKEYNKNKIEDLTKKEYDEIVSRLEKKNEK